MSDPIQQTTPRDPNAENNEMLWIIVTGAACMAMFALVGIVMWVTHA